MSDYIKREDALGMHFSEGLHADMVLYVRYAEVKEHLQNVPSADVVEVVRCKDCKFWDSDCIWCDLWGNTQEYYDGYCNYGEREEQDNECK